MPNAAPLNTKEKVYDFIKETVKETVGASLKEVQEQSKENMKALLYQQEKLADKKAHNRRKLSRIIMCTLAGGSRGLQMPAIKYAEKHFPNDEDVIKALSSSQGGEGGFLIQEELSDDFIELLREDAVVDRLGPVNVPLDAGNLRMPKLTGGSSGNWIGENQDAPKTQPVFGSITLSAKKYASLVPISNDLIRRAGTQVEQLVRDDLVADIAEATDIAYIRGDGTGGQPKGLRNLVDASHVVAQTTPVNLDNVTKDLGEAMQFLMDAKIRMRRAGWIMEPRTWRALITVRDGNANLVFQPEMKDKMLMGFPFEITSQIPRNLGGGTETELYFGEFSNVIVGRATQVLITASDDASYFDGTSMVSAYQQDQTVIRAIIETDINLRHDKTIFVRSGVTWDAI